MAKKKKPKKLNAPIEGSGAVKPAKKGGGKKKLASRILQPRALSTFAFGSAGLLAGIATGLNHFPALGQSLPIPRMMLLAAYLGDPHVDMQAGLETGMAGLIMGACLGFSALSDPKDMGMSLVLSVGLAVLGFTFTNSALVAGLGFLVGHTPAILAYLKLRNA